MCLGVVTVSLLVIQSFNKYNLVPCHYQGLGSGGGVGVERQSASARQERREALELSHHSPAPDFR